MGNKRIATANERLGHVPDTFELSLYPRSLAAPFSMNLPFLKSVILSGAVLAAASVAVRAEDEAQALSKEQLAKFDAGPTTVDISAYPVALKDNYSVFRQKCNQCHTLARPINCQFALPGEWSRYIKRMMFKPGSNISPCSGEEDLRVLGLRFLREKEGPLR